MLINANKPNSATWPEILAILMGPPNCEVSALPKIIAPMYFNDEVLT